MYYVYCIQFPIDACMAASLLSHVVSDLCIGKPPARVLPPSTPVAAALAALRTGDDPFVFVVDADEALRHSRGKKIAAGCVVVKVSVADVLCYVCGDADNLSDPRPRSAGPCPRSRRPCTLVVAIITAPPSASTRTQGTHVTAGAAAVNSAVDSSAVECHDANRESN